MIFNECNFLSSFLSPCICIRRYLVRQYIVKDIIWLIPSILFFWTEFFTYIIKHIWLRWALCVYVYELPWLSC